MNEQSILVTGSSGTIGTALVERLLAEGTQVYGTDVRPNPWSETVDRLTVPVDLRQRDAFSALPDEVSTVVHLAANARVHELVKEPRLAMENIQMTFNALEYAREHDASGFVFASSREVYGNVGQVEADEGDTTADRSESPYAASKTAGEALVDAYGNCYGLDTAIVRFSNVYGRYDASDRVVPLFVAQSARGEELTVFGASKLLDFTYVDDTVDGIVSIVRKLSAIQGMTVNIASGRGKSLVELAYAIDERTPNDSNVSIESSRTGEVQRYVADISRAKRVLGYEPSYSLADGLDETVQWYLDRPELLDEILGISAEHA